MASRSGRRRVDHSSPLVDLDDVFADDALIDAIAAGPWGADPGTAALLDSAGPFGADGNVLTAEPLTELFGNWRQELACMPIPAPPAIPKAVSVAGKPRPRRSHRPALAIAAAIAALLVGSTFVGSRQATEGSALWNVTAVLWPDRVESVASRDKVRSAIAVAETAINEGRPDEAQAVLLNASFEIGKVDEADGRQDLQSSLEGLWKKAAPADQSPASADQKQWVADGSTSSTARSSSANGAQQVAVLEQPAAALTALPPVNTPGAGVQVAVAEAPGDNGGSGGSATDTGVVSPAGGAAGNGAGSSSAAVAAAVKPSPPENSPEAVSDTPASSASTPPAAPIVPTTDKSTPESPTSGSTEPAPAPTPTLPTPTAASPGAGPTAGVVGDANVQSSTSTDSPALSVADSTPVLPSP